MNDSISKKQLAEIGNEWMHLQFVTGQEYFSKIFSEVSSTDYLTLLLLNRKHGLSDGSVYLKEIAADQEVPMSKVSQRVQKLQEKGLVYWDHDEEGTYITISESGEAAMMRQQEKVTELMSRTVEQFGYDRFRELITMRHELNGVIGRILS